MPLSRHIDPEYIINQSKQRPLKQPGAAEGEVPSEAKPASIAASHYYQSWRRDEDAQGIPKYTIPAYGIPSKSAYQLLHDEMCLDGNPTLNLASFVHTWMPEEATKLIMETINKNAVDLDEYPASQTIHNRCISMLADLWKAPKTLNAIGTATSGSSEAIMLAGLAMKKRWQQARKAAGKNYFHPNVVFGANAQVALEKFARYWDVEARLVPVHESSNFVMNPSEALEYIDENTVGVMVILGSTYTGHFENVQLMSELLDDLDARTGLNVPIHVDAASGGFIAPFAYPKLKWAFDVPRVVSINTSGHKFGLVYPGLGFVLWRDESFLHKDLIFELHYLGGTQYSYTLNFSKPAAPIVAQMFNFLNLGYEGYRKIAIKGLRNARLLARALEMTAYFKVLSSIHHPSALSPEAEATNDDDPAYYEPGLPVIAFRLSDEFKKEYPHVQQYWIQTLLRTKGWIVPNYAAPHEEEKTEILRVVVRETLSADLVECLIADIVRTTEVLMSVSTLPAPSENTKVKNSASTSTPSIDNRSLSSINAIQKPPPSYTPHSPLRISTNDGIPPIENSSPLARTPMDATQSVLSHSLIALARYAVISTVRAVACTLFSIISLLDPFEDRHDASHESFSRIMHHNEQHSVHHHAFFSMLPSPFSRLLPPSTATLPSPKPAAAVVSAITSPTELNAKVGANVNAEVDSLPMGGGEKVGVRVILPVSPVAGTSGGHAGNSVHHLDHVRGRPDVQNFAGGDSQSSGLKQATYAKQC